MAQPKVFVSSTCYDLATIRSELRSFIHDLGCDPVLSEYSDVLYDPKHHTHTSCLQELGSTDLVVVIIGSRFGGRAIPKAVEMLDYERLSQMSANPNFLKDKHNLSIAQLEVLQAIQNETPVFTFVDSGVLNDHQTYEKNKTKQILSEIEFPHIDKQETAVYIFEFINFLRQMSANNAIFPFQKLDDIKDTLRKQWAALFQRLLYERRLQRAEERRIDLIASQIADIKTAIFTTISSRDLKDTARAAIQYRRLIDFVREVNHSKLETRTLLKGDMSWDDLLKKMTIIDVTSVDDSTTFPYGILLYSDNTYFQMRMPSQSISHLKKLWDEFRNLKPQAKEAIISAIVEASEGRPMIGRYIDEEFVPRAKRQKKSHDLFKK